MRAVLLIYGRQHCFPHPRPLNLKNTASRSLGAVKSDIAWIVPSWGTTREYQVSWFYLFLCVGASDSLSFENAGRPLPVSTRILSS